MKVGKMQHISEKNFSRLLTAVEWSEKQLSYFRDKRLESIKLLVGHHYASDGTQKREPVNFLKLATDIYIRALASRSPRVLIYTDIPDLKPTAANLEIAVNQIPEEIDLTATLRRWVMESLFGIGVVKVGLHEIGEVLGCSYGTTFVDVVTADDYFVDMSAKSWKHIQFEGNDYWPVYDDVMEWAELGKKEAKDLHPDESYYVNESVTQRAESITVPKQMEEYKQRIRVRDIWLPQDGLIITYAVTSKKVLKEVEWDGPEYGPYHKLFFHEVPGNLLPIPSVAMWRDLHELGNSLFRKIANQADSQKTVLGFMGDDEEGVQNFKKANDGEGIRYKGQKPAQLTAGGVDARTLAFYLQVRNLSSYFASNLDALGGLAAQSETVGQDRLISESASAVLRDMSSKTIDAIRGVFKDLCYYEWHDPVKVRKFNKSVPSFPELSVPIEFGPESKEGDFNDYNLDIDVYSLIDDSPNLKLQRLGMIMQQYVYPLSQEIQRQGGQIDVQEILSLVAKYADFKELKDIIFFMETGAMGEQSISQQQYTSTAQKSQGGESRSGPTMQGQEAMMQQLLLSGNQQSAELEA